MRCGLKLLLIVVALVAILCWVFDDGYREIYREDLSSEYRLTIRGLSDAGKLHLQFTYHYPPGIGLLMIDRCTIAEPKNALQFSSVTSSVDGLRCIYDTNNSGLLFLFSPSDRDIWHSHREGGFNGSRRSDWVPRFEELKEEFPDLPYAELPENIR